MLSDGDVASEDDGFVVGSPAKKPRPVGRPPATFTVAVAQAPLQPADTHVLWMGVLSLQWSVTTATDCDSHKEAQSRSSRVGAHIVEYHIVVSKWLTSAVLSDRHIVPPEVSGQTNQLNYDLTVWVG